MALKKEVLNYTIAPTESAYNWKGLLEELKDLGVKEDVLLFISDGLKGMSDAVLNVFPKATYQVCFVHVTRNIMHKVRVEDRAAICDDFKKVPQATSLENVQKALADFCES